MALTQTQKYKILHAIGYPPRTLDSTSTSYIKQVADKLTSFPSDAEDLLSALLDRMDALDSQLQKMVAQSNVKSVDDIEFFEDGAVDLRRERNRVAREIAQMVDIVPGPAFMAGGYRVSI